MIRETPPGARDFSCAFTDGEIRSATHKAERRRGEAIGPFWFFGSVDSKRVSNLVSPLESIAARAHINVALKRVSRIPRGLREIASGEGPEGAWTTCRRGWMGHR